MKRVAKWFGLCLPLTLAACAGMQTAGEPPAPPAPPWSMEGGGPARVSRSEVAAVGQWAPRRLTQLHEEVAYEPEEYATPIVVGPGAYVGHSGKRFEAVRWEDGTPLWSYASRGRIVGTAASADGLFFVADDEGYLAAVRSDGREAWRFHASYPIVTSPVAAGGKVYIAVSDQNVFCLEAATGRPIWQYGRKFPHRNSQWRTPNLAWSNNRCFAGFADGALVALDGDVGKVLWKMEPAKEGLFGDIVAGPSVAEGKVYVGALRGPIVCLEASTGKELWRRELGVSSGFAIGEGRLFAGTPSGNVVALSLGDGSKLWEARLDGGVPGLPVLASDSVVVGAAEGSLFALDPTTGAVRQSFSPGSGVRGQPLVFGGGILFVSNAGALFRIEVTR